MTHRLYHVTAPENVSSIMREGLKRKGFAVYLSKNPFSWWKPGMVILRVRTSGLKGEMTTFLPESDEILYWGDIGPARVKEYRPKKSEYEEALSRYRDFFPDSEEE